MAKQFDIKWKGDSGLPWINRESNESRPHGQLAPFDEERKGLSTACTVSYPRDDDNGK